MTKLTIGKTAFKREIFANDSNDFGNAHLVSKITLANNARPVVTESSTKISLVSPKHTHSSGQQKYIAADTVHEVTPCGCRHRQIGLAPQISASV